MKPHLFYGPNNFLKQVALQKFKADFQQTEGELNISILESQVTSNTIILNSQTPPFLGSRRLLLIRDFDFKNATPELLKFLAQLPDFCELVFENSALDSRTRLFKTLKKYGELHEFKDLKPGEFAYWLRTEIKNRKLNFEPAAFNLLTTFTRCDLATADRELTKLATFANGSCITATAVNALTHPDLHANIFELTDAIGQRQIKTALAVLHDLVARGENLFQIFAMIVRQFRILLLLSTLARRKLPPAEIVSLTKLHPFVVQKTLAQIRNFNLNELLAAHRALLQIDQAVKTGRLTLNSSLPEFQFALEKFILKFSV